jgi:hypothetical protein
VSHEEHEDRSNEDHEGGVLFVGFVAYTFVA